MLVCPQWLDVWFTRLPSEAMGVDGKYGRVTTERGDIGSDEPVLVFRAQDRLLPKVLMYYHLFCLKAGSPRRHLDAILDTLANVQRWQSENPTKLPESVGYEKDQGWTKGGGT